MRSVIPTAWTGQRERSRQKNPRQVSQRTLESSRLADPALPAGFGRVHPVQHPEGAASFGQVILPARAAQSSKSESVEDCERRTSLVVRILYALRGMRILIRSVSPSDAVAGVKVCGQVSSRCGRGGFPPRKSQRVLGTGKSSAKALSAVWLGCELEFRGIPLQ